jgi:hypothetical protein
MFYARPVSTVPVLFALEDKIPFQMLDSEVARAHGAYWPVLYT